MAFMDFKEAIGLLMKMPVLWIPGVIAGLLAASLWIVLNISGSFFVSRLGIVFALVILLFNAGMLALIKKGEGGIRMLISEGVRYYFRVLLPQLVIVFAVMVVFVLVMIMVTLAIGGTPDISILTILSLCIMLPTLFLTFFFDTAAVFEDLRVFDSIRRSITLAATHVSGVISFFLVCVAFCFVVIFGLMVIWEAFLYDRLQPLTTYNETQIASFNPDQLVALIGPGGMWITASVIFFGILVLLPVLMTYKACFFRKIAGRPGVIQQQPGEYDSKGRYYKY